MITLANSCYCSDLKVYPQNWKTSKASIKEDWMVYYRFYDPQFRQDPKYKKGKLVRLKGMNGFKTLLDRQNQTVKILEAELIKLKEEGFNPITGHFMQVALSSTIKASSPFLQALTDVERLITSSKSTKRDLKSTLGFVALASQQLGLSGMPVCQISRKHIKLLLNQIEANQAAESAHRYNKNRTYLMMLFKELVELEAIDTNPVREISKKQRMVPIRKLLTPAERTIIDKHLRESHYRFWLFTHIFFHSGSRLTEMMQVKGSDVDLVNQKFVVTVKKGKLFKQFFKPIKNSCLEYWREAIADCSDNEFVFSEGLIPGKSSINTDQITKRWKKHVKDKLGIDADFYSLKHLNLDETAALLDINAAAEMASHTNSKITAKHYALNEGHRQNQRLIDLPNRFA
jgi:integrase